MFEYYMQMKMLCEVKGSEAKDVNIKKFLANAAEGFGIKANKLLISDLF